MSSARPRQREPEVPAVSASARARLLLNTQEFSDRRVRIGGESFGVLHLSIGNLERFRAASARLEELYTQFAETELPLTNFMKIYRDEAIDLFRGSIPECAALVLGAGSESLKRRCRPLDLLSVAISQWLHNLEIGRLHELFPHPPSEEDDAELEGDPNVNNPMAIVERVVSATHWSFEDALSRTVPQIYLMGVSSAWAYEKIKSGSDDSGKVPSRKKVPIKVDGKTEKNFKKMNSQEYRQYLESVFGGMPAGASNPIGMVQPK